MSSSSSSSSNAQRRYVYGVPTRCWCGSKLKIFVAGTKENQGRRFFRCVVSRQRKSESHLFKWEDEALLDEVRMSDAKRMDLAHDVQALSECVKERLKEHESHLQQEISGTLATTAAGMIVGREERIFNTTSPLVDASRLTKIAVGCAVLGTAAWFCLKLN